MEPREVTLVDALSLIGLGSAESAIVALLLKQKSVGVQDLIRKTGLSRGTVFKALSRLMEEGYVVKTGKGAVRYSMAPSFTNELRSRLDRSYRLLISELRKTTVTETVEIQQVCKVFEKNGYLVREVPHPAVTRPSSRAFRFVDRIVDRDYSVAITVLDRVKMEHSGPSEMIYSRILAACRDLDCLTAFVYIHSDLDVDRAYEFYESFARDFAAAWRFPRESFGMPDKWFYVFRPGADVLEQTDASIQELRQKWITVSDSAKMLRTKLQSINDSIVMSHMTLKNIDSMMTGKYLGFFTERKITRELVKLAPPIDSIRNRENRNLGTFERLFSENEVRINQNLEALGKKIYLPSLSLVERDSAELEMLLSRLRPIEYELNTLSEGITSYSISLLERGEPKINPFLFTEPYEPKGFYVNQQHLERSAQKLAELILQGSVGRFQFIRGQPGTGKTHGLKYVYTPILEKTRIKPIYVDCPLNYDLLEGIFPELTQESQYDESMRPAIRNLRKTPPSTPRDFGAVLRDITDLWLGAGYHGVVIVLDELENALPYEIVEKRMERYQPPLALRQLHDIVARIPHEKLGLLAACRERAYPTIKSGLQIDNLDSFTITPDNLSEQHFEKIIEHRYEAWKIKHGPEFADPCISKIINMANGNTRDVIKYLRELFNFATRNGIHVVTDKTIEKIGTVPMFTE